MGKSWRETPGKYRNNRDFQKKQQKKNKGQRSFTSSPDNTFGDSIQPPLADMGVEGCNDFETSG
jgi:hypothetical protein